MDHTPHCHYLQYVRNESADGCRESLGIPILLSVRLSQEIRIEEGEQDFAEEPYPIILLRRRKFAKLAATDAKVFIHLLLFGEAWTSKRCLAGTLSLMVYARLLKLRGTSLERGASTTVTRNTCPGFLSSHHFNSRVPAIRCRSQGIGRTVRFSRYPCTGWGLHGETPCTNAGDRIVRQNRARPTLPFLSALPYVKGKVQIVELVLATGGRQVRHLHPPMWRKNFVSTFGAVQPSSACPSRRVSG